MVANSTGRLSEKFRLEDKLDWNSLIDALGFVNIEIFRCFYYSR